MTHHFTVGIVAGSEGLRTLRWDKVWMHNYIHQDPTSQRRLCAVFAQLKDLWSKLRLREDEFRLAMSENAAKLAELQAENKALKKRLDEACAMDSLPPSSSFVPLRDHTAGQ